ncbi:MAG: hypothetical protein GY861_28665 [bacterium]|nr:hypothetical protein [bacterium]
MYKYPLKIQNDFEAELTINDFIGAATMLAAKYDPDGFLAVPCANDSLARQEYLLQTLMGLLLNHTKNSDWKFIITKSDASFLMKQLVLKTADIINWPRPIPPEYLQIECDTDDDQIPCNIPDYRGFKMDSGIALRNAASIMNLLYYSREAFL